MRYNIVSARPVATDDDTVVRLRIQTEAITDLGAVAHRRHRGHVAYPYVQVPRRLLGERVRARRKRLLRTSVAATAGIPTQLASLHARHDGRNNVTLLTYADVFGSEANEYAV